MRWWSAVTAGALFTTLLVLTGGRGLLLHVRETSGMSYFCSGWSGCNAAGYSDSGYGAVSNRSYWRMYPGHNCVNYAAYRMIQAGLPNVRPWTGGGNAANWGHEMASITNQTPAVGAVAWWDAYHHVGSAGHVAYVEKVISPTDIIISEDSWSGTFHWQELTTTGGFWPSGFIHFKDKDAGPVLANQVPPSVTGTPQVGQVLTAKPGTWTGGPTSYGYAWTANGTAIPGATASTFTPTATEVGKQIAVRVTANRAKSTAVSAASALTGAVAKGVFAVTARSGYTGDPMVGQTLTATGGSWVPTPASYTYQWQADGKDIPGATDSTLTLTPDLAGAKIGLITQVRAAGYRLAKRGSAVANVLAGQIAIDSLYVLAGAQRPGSILSVTGTFTPSDATPSYQWLRGGQPIAGATQPTYRVSGDDLGQHLAVRVTLSKDNWRGTSGYDGAETFVREPAKVVVRTRGTRGGAVVHVHVSAWRVTGLDTLVTVKLGGRKRTVQLADGDAIVTFTDVPAGTRKVRVHLHRGDKVEPTSVPAEVVVR